MKGPWTAAHQLSRRHRCSAGGVQGRRRRVPCLHHGGAAAGESHRRRGNIAIAIGDDDQAVGSACRNGRNSGKNTLCPWAARDCKPIRPDGVHNERCSLPHTRKRAAWYIGVRLQASLQLAITQKLKWFLRAMSPCWLCKMQVFARPQEALVATPRCHKLRR